MGPVQCPYAAFLPVTCEPTPCITVAAHAARSLMLFVYAATDGHCCKSICAALRPVTY